MNILLLTSHSIAEYDDLRMLTDLGYDVFSIGAYTDPGHPTDDKRPALPGVPFHPDLAGLCDTQRAKHATDDPSFVIDWAKGDLNPELVDWADVIIDHHFPVPWLVAQWPKIRHKRVIWRTCGQSDPDLEREMKRLAGLEIVRYSPKEKVAFERMGAFAGQNAMIRFGKYPDDWYGWTGEESFIGNITQDMAGRGEATGLSFWLAATQGLPAKPAGPGSEKLLGGAGALGYDEMREYLRRCRAYLYTGTQPASYTLGLIEAMMTGVPVVSIGPEKMWLEALFEGHELVGWERRNGVDPADLREARAMLKIWLAEPDWEASSYMRRTAIELFGIEQIGRQWLELLGNPARVEVKRIAVTAA